MARDAVVKHSGEGLEFKIIGSFFGLMIACAGLLAGTMMTGKSLDYWYEDIVPLGLAIIMGFRLLRGLTVTIGAIPVEAHPHAKRQAGRATVKSEQVAMGRLPSQTSANYSPEEVVEQVVKRIEAQKAAQAAKQPGNK